MTKVERLERLVAQLSTRVAEARAEVVSLASAVAALEGTAKRNPGKRYKARLHDLEERVETAVEAVRIADRKHLALEKRVAELEPLATLATLAGRAS